MSAREQHRQAAESKRSEKFNRVVDMIVAADHRPRHAAVELAERLAEGHGPHASFAYPYADRRALDAAVKEIVEERAKARPR